VLLDIKQEVHIALDGKIEANVIGYACLPNASLLVVFLGAERRMANVRQKKSKLFLKRFLNLWRQFRKRAPKLRRAKVLH